VVVSTGGRIANGTGGQVNYLAQVHGVFHLLGRSILPLKRTMLSIPTTALYTIREIIMESVADEFGKWAFIGFTPCLDLASY